MQTPYYSVLFTAVYADFLAFRIIHCFKCLQPKAASPKGAWVLASVDAVVRPRRRYSRNPTHAQNDPAGGNPTFTRELCS